MRWTPGGKSSDVEDRRGSRGFGGGGARIGIGGALVLLVLSLLFRRDFFTLVGVNGSETGAAGPDSLVQFVSFVLDDAQNTWTEVMEQRGEQYQRAKLVLFRGAVQSACGNAQAAMGPFYCPGDAKVYIDLGFYDELRRRFGAPGDFAQAYVLAHEIGHHIQRLSGTEEQVRQTQQRRPDAANALSVAMELQADCYAGVWGHSTAQRDILEQGDVEEGLGAAAAVGDDRIQQMQGEGVQPESFTHGSSADRVRWFKRGLASGRPEDCDPFGG
jgi:predicted metalloprotease